ncbi:tetratricopeptide repeat protein [Flexithrix dorotheae]|uniref:tetratricopeptide repeat protein n=1 Tax=Flexithrix dorotheae TaxID=70993 RepID=UPI00036F1BEA|nr:tetratricopeptide repeat protein [Flexithrix dorotheae]
MAKKSKVASKKSAEQHAPTVTDYMENPEAIQESLSKSQEFATSHKNLLTGIFAAIILLLGGFFYYQWYNSNQEVTAQEQLFPAIFYLQKDSLNKALDGDGNFTDGFVAIAEDYSSTKAGNLANFYAGVSYLKLGEYDNAINYLQQFDESGVLIEARDYCLLGDAYMEKGDYANAITNYKKASETDPNKEFTPIYLMKLAIAHESADDLAAAKEAYQEIIDDYKDSQEATKAKKYLARIAQK